MKLIAGTIIIFLLPVLLYSQAATTSPPDSTQSGYVDVSVMGGPGDLSEQITQDNKKNEEAILEYKKKIFPGWFRTKKKISDKTGLQFTASYALGYMHASHSLGQRWAFGGIFQFDLQWVYLRNKIKNNGLLGLRIESRHPIFSTITLSQLGEEIGSLWKTDISFGKVYFRLTQFWWEQHFWGNKAGVRIGKTVNPAYIYDMFYFRNPFWGLESEPTVFSAAPWPANPLGLIGAVKPVKNVYILAGIHDANGSFNDFGFNTVFNGEYFYVIEVGYTPPKGTEKSDNYHVTWWYKDGIKSEELSSGWGFIFSFQRLVKKKFVPFIRYSYSVGGLTSMESLITAGLGLNFKKTDRMAFALYYGSPSNHELRSQFGLEGLYQLNLFSNLYIVPTTQILFNPSYNTGQSVIGVFSLRVRIAL